MHTGDHLGDTGLQRCSVRSFRRKVLNSPGTWGKAVDTESVREGLRLRRRLPGW